MSDQTTKESLTLTQEAEVVEKLIQQEKSWNSVWLLTAVNSCLCIASAIHVITWLQAIASVMAAVGMVLVFKEYLNHRPDNLQVLLLKQKLDRVRATQVDKNFS